MHRVNRSRFGLEADVCFGVQSGDRNPQVMRLPTPSGAVGVGVAQKNRHAT